MKAKSSFIINLSNLNNCVNLTFTRILHYGSICKILYVCRNDYIFKLWRSRVKGEVSYFENKSEKQKIKNG